MGKKTVNQTNYQITQTGGKIDMSYQGTAALQNALGYSGATARFSRSAKKYFSVARVNALKNALRNNAADMVTLAGKMLAASPMVGTPDRVTIIKSTAFSLESSNQLAARLGGGASLIEAQVEASHGRLLAAKVHNKVSAILRVCSETIAINSQVGEECRVARTLNSLVDEELRCVDPFVMTRMQFACARALRSAQAACLGIAQVTENNAPSFLDTKKTMLEKIYLAAQKQKQVALCNKPYLLMLNKVVAERALANG